MSGLTATVLADHWNGGPGAWWPIFPLLWFVMIFAFIFFASRCGWRRGPWRGERWSAGAGHSRLAERFAAGEIDEQEYRTRRAVLDER